MNDNTLSADTAQLCGKKLAEKVEEILPCCTDSTGAEITKVYGRRVPDYAVYQTAARASVQYADDKIYAKEQRKWMAPLNVLRAQIDALVDGWRTNSKDKAKGYDARVAAALILCLESDLTGAQTSLTEIKNDILAERNSWGRLQYLISASSVAAIIAAVLALAWAVSVEFVCRGLPPVFEFGTGMSLAILGAILGFVGGVLGFAQVFKHDLGKQITEGGKIPLTVQAKRNPSVQLGPWALLQRYGLLIAAAVTFIVVLLFGAGAWVVASCPSAFVQRTSGLNLGTTIWIAGIGGVGGAFFSIALGIMHRTVATSLNPRDNCADATLRVIVGLIGAWVLILLYRAKLVPDLSIAGGSQPANSLVPVEITLLLGFVAGFLERLVPDLLEKKTGTITKEDQEKQRLSDEKLKQTEKDAKEAEKTKEEHDRAVAAEVKLILDATRARATGMQFDENLEKRLREFGKKAAEVILKEPAGKQEAVRKDATVAFLALIDKTIDEAKPATTLTEAALKSALQRLPNWPFKT